ncbi:WD40-repeat-containing domain protein [Neohortaea acidophila]|uniref:WD40-repeat-containing domain protein n=1 Tax=Neohortaea acidophila TaxID=245834 RepID=A0A6A6PWK4_9PEZI|nr:WD40-repeat-containing domain protein [Neohortaea acidophila]KAF2484422.1 WD40-repeat-containing domain protein [Neohortaea acidophila]
MLVPNIRALSWSPTGSMIATCTAAQIRIWNPDRANVKSSTEIRNGHNASFAGSPGGNVATVEKVAFCPTMDHVLGSTGGDGGVRLWDVRVPGGAAGGGKGTALADFKAGEPGRDPALFFTWHPNGHEMLVGTKEDVVYSVDARRMSSFDAEPNPQWSLDGTLLTPFPDQKTSTHYYGMSFSNSGRHVFATTAEGPVKILDYPSMSILHTLSAHSGTTYSVQQSPRGDWLAVGGQDSLITIWDTYDWHCAHMLVGHGSPVRDLSFSFDGTYLITGSGQDAREGTSGMEVYHVDTGDVAHVVDTVNPVSVSAWHPLRYWIAYAGDAGGLKIVGVGSNV